MYFVTITRLICLIITTVTASNEQLPKSQEVRRLQEYIKINTTIGRNLDPAVRFWSKLALSARAKFSVYEYVKNYPVVVLKWQGKNSSLSSIVLKTNMDVVPANVEDGWTYPPFSANIDEDGDMYGRGTQGYKSLSLQQYEAVSRLEITKNLTRDFYMVLTPDKETGSKNGFAKYVQSQDFEDINAGFFLVPGTPTPGNEIAVLYRGKTRWYFRVEFTGTSGSSSRFFDLPTLASGPCECFYATFIKYRASQYRLYQKCSDIADVTVLNFIGVEENQVIGAVPTKICLYFDAYLAVNINFCDFQAMVKQWANKCGENLKFETIILQEACRQTTIGKSNPYWVALQNASKKLNIPFKNQTSPGLREATYIVQAGYSAFGVSPLPNTEELVYAVNERINIKTYMKGITIFEEIFRNIGNIPAEKESDDPSDYSMMY